MKVHAEKGSDRGGGRNGTGKQEGTYPGVLGVARQTDRSQHRSGQKPASFVSVANAWNQQTSNRNCDGGLVSRRRTSPAVRIACIPSTNGVDWDPLETIRAPNRRYN